MADSSTIENYEDFTCQEVCDKIDRKVGFIQVSCFNFVALEIQLSFLSEFFVEAEVLVSIVMGRVLVARKIEKVGNNLHFNIHF